MAETSDSTSDAGDGSARITPDDVELYLNEASAEEARHAAICLLHRLGELKSELAFCTYPPGDVARTGAELLMDALRPITMPHEPSAAIDADLDWLAANHLAETGEGRQRVQAVLDRIAALPLTHAGTKARAGARHNVRL